VPFHAARRWAGGHAPGTGRWQWDYDVRVGRTVPRSAFVPPPPAGAATLVVRRRNH
jgi:16S rRNA A1518/A1519 N6-dimethyltransferase RsmA/KsgA/DIM1 with predicted DNA glycosylase/AP lyase activity